MKVRNHAFKEKFDIFSISLIGVRCGALLTIIPNLQYIKRNSISLQERLSIVLVSLLLLCSFETGRLA
jgi:hypothetical protein